MHPKHPGLRVSVLHSVGILDVLSSSGVSKGNVIIATDLSYPNPPSPTRATPRDRFGGLLPEVDEDIALDEVWVAAVGDDQ